LSTFIPARSQRRDGAANVQIPSEPTRRRAVGKAEKRLCFAAEVRVSDSLEYLLPLEVKRVVGAGEVDGYASTFGNVDLAGDIVAPGAFKRTLAEHKAANTMPALLWGHDPVAPCGVWTDAREDRIGLRMTGRLTLDTVRGAEARALALDGALGLSIGFRTRDSGFEKNRRVLKDVQLFEVSLVAIPANPQAKLVSVKSAVEGGQLTPRMIERLLCDGGVPRAFAKALIANGFRAAARCGDAEAVDALAEDIRRGTERLNSVLRKHRNG
jgi:Escherichia/Staphylococcus phage prohead protease